MSSLDERVGPSDPGGCLAHHQERTETALDLADPVRVRLRSTDRLTNQNQ